MYQLYLFLIIKACTISQWFGFVEFHCKFVSKKELGKVFKYFFNLRHGGSALIDRKDQKQAIPAIKGWST
jgi:1-acyl-sn-glycerol-3-phosphate acyltransferase